MIPVEILTKDSKVIPLEKENNKIKYLVTNLKFLELWKF